MVAVDGAALRRELERRAIPLDLSASGSLEPFASLDAVAERAKVAAVVESHHFVHEKYAFRLAAVRYLRDRGWTWFGEELGWSDGRRIDQFLAGDDDALDRVPMYGYAGVRRVDRLDRPWGILRAGYDAHPEAALAHEQRTFARAVRATAPGSRWFGFDVDGWSTAAYEQLAEMRLPDRLRDGLQPVAGESLAEEAARIEAVVAGRADEPLDPEVDRLLDALVTTLAYAAEAYAAATWDELRPPLARREALMHRHVDAVLDEPAFAAGERVGLLAGSLHLVKDEATVTGRSDGIGPGGDQLPAIGHHVAHRPDVGPARVLAIWMLVGSGRDTNPMVTTEQRIEPLPGTLNALLADVCAGQPVLVPVGDLAGPVIVQHMYNATFTTPLAGQIDAIVFVPEVGPLREP
jgi:erythromycin esterase-like protein